jgi:hypothetical protein
MMNYPCCPFGPEGKTQDMTQGKDYSIGTLNERGRVGPPAEVAAMNSTTSQKVAESGLVLRQPL